MKRTRPIFWLIAMLLLAAMACNFVSGDDEPTAVPEQATAAVQEEAASPTDTPLPAPTEAPTTAPEPTEAPPTEAPETEDPADEGSVASEPELAFASYVHPSDYFEITPPAGWEIGDESEGGTSFSEPSGVGYVEVEVTNTGTTLDGTSFERFIDARELNLFGELDGYEIVDYQIDPDLGVARVTKEVVLDGIPQTIFTYYDLYDHVMYATDFWADSDVYDVYAPAYEAMLDSMFVDSEAVAESAVPYYWIQTFYGPGDLFSIDVPLPWLYTRAEEEDVIVDAFYSPDEYSFIENITYDDGEAISKSEAGAFALELLKEFYASDIQISDDTVQPDGSERLTWRSPSGEYSGISFLETRGTAFLLFSVAWEDAYEDAYLDTLLYTIESYDVP